MTHEEHDPRPELLAGLTYVEAKIAELQQARQRYRDRLARLDEEQRLRRAGGVDWRDEAHEVGTDRVYTGLVVATDLLNAIHRINQDPTRPNGGGDSVRAWPT
jgi:hypothetical protein